MQAMTAFFEALKGEKIPAQRNVADQTGAHNLNPRCQCQCRPT